MEGGMEGCSETSAGAVPVLPDDPLVEILSRVPAKSVCRFKCVSKAWRDLITHPDNRKKLCQAMQGWFFETKLARTGFSYIDLTVRSVPLDIDPCFSFLPEMHGIKPYILDSCNGLILLGRRQDLFDGLILHYTVCNPTTKQWSDVLSCGSRELGVGTFAYLAFAPNLSSHFHLVQFQIPDPDRDIESLHVYSSETGTWSQNQIDEQKKQGQLEGWHHFTLDNETGSHLWAFVNGCLHVMVSWSNLRHILVVDVQGKARRMIAVPGMADGRHEHSYVYYLGQSQGHLHCVTLQAADNKTHYEMCTWVIQDYDTQEWVLKNTVDLNSLGFSESSFSKFAVVDIHQDCNVVFFLESCKLYAYDMDRKEVSIIATFQYPKSPTNFSRYVPYFSESLDLTNEH